MFCQITKILFLNYDDKFYTVSREYIKFQFYASTDKLDANKTIEIRINFSEFIMLSSLQVQIPPTYG